LGRRRGRRARRGWWDRKLVEAMGFYVN
jgi:hypothetical protein